MQCPFCNGVPPLLEQSVERPHMIQTDFWFVVSDIGPIPENFLRWDFKGVEGAAVAVQYVKKRKGGATLTAHYCITEGDTIFTMKSRVPLSKRDQAALFGFMKDSLRLTETRGRKRKKIIEDVRAALQASPKASIRRLALDLGVTRETVRQLIKAGGKTLSQLQREAREKRDEAEY
jgi:hypothetical protein